MRLLRDRDEQFIMREHRQLPVLLVPLHTVQAQRQPVGKREVHRLVEVELNFKDVRKSLCVALKTYSMVESSMISFGERDDEFSRTLVAGKDSYARRGESSGIHQGDELE